MDQKHRHCLKNINLLIGISRKQNRHDRHMPRMFRIVFVSALTGQVRLAENILFFINLQNEFQLFFQSLVHIFPPFYCIKEKLLPTFT